MPYLGNSPVAGDHVNNFKVLDDISSHTATFDGSATSVVDTTNNTIRVVEHRFIQGQRVTYTNGGGGNIGGLTTGTAYFVIFDTLSTFKLATQVHQMLRIVLRLIYHQLVQEIHIHSTLRLMESIQNLN